MSDSGPGKVSGGSESQSSFLAGRDSSELPLCNESICYTDNVHSTPTCVLPRGHRGVHSDGQSVTWTR